LVLALSVLSLAAGCGRNRGVDPHLGRAYPQKLSEWRLFTATRPSLKPNTGVLIYDVNTPLFSDYAHKVRTVWMPAGREAKFDSSRPFEFPIGTILSKTFSFPQKDGTDRKIETRILVRQNDGGWTDLVYIWNAEQTEAVLDPSPMPVPVRWVDTAGNERSTDYSIPNVNQCTVCHDHGAPLGPTARNLRLDRWENARYLSSLPPGAVPRRVAWDDPATGTVAERAGMYMEVNCTPCHRELHPTSKAHHRPLTPADAQEILARMGSLDPNKMMPSLGHTIVHREGLQLIEQWANSLPPRT
jgi:uncharacterized repeat protein (TIGR03806 family)